MANTLIPFPWLDLLLILALVALNGVLSMSELAIVSSREARLKALTKGGSRGAETALEMAASPGRFLSTVQTGITLIGILAGAFSGARLGTPVAQRIELLGVGAETAEQLGFGLVIVLTTYASLIIGELVPKQFALRNPEPIAAMVARPMLWLSGITAPFVWLLDKTSQLFFRLLGLDRDAKTQVTAEELHLVVAEAQTAGLLEESERAIISGIVRLADRPVREVMTPRIEIDWLDVDSSRQEIREELTNSPHSRFPVARGNVDDIVGVVSARAMLEALLDDEPLDLSKLAQTPPVVPDMMDAMDALGVLRAAEVPMALVHDEYGHLDGIVTAGSILSSLAGVFSSDLDDGENPHIIEREDGSYMLSGAASVDVLEDQLGMIPDEDRDYSTVAGFALDVMKKLPGEGECFVSGGWDFEVMEMDGRKIVRLLATPVAAPEDESDDG